MARSDQRTRLTRMLIRQAFTSLLREKPVQSISVKELCERAGINRGGPFILTIQTSMI